MGKKAQHSGEARRLCSPNLMVWGSLNWCFVMKLAIVGTCKMGNNAQNSGNP